ncbi:MAG TPA: tRNA (adenosine(37)-N6)-dimethylallyltransferase MiaA [Armatimonadota bacterium]|jgi:tRNA dimethylallyltransferase
MSIPLLVIVGPTGSGKTETAVLVARAVGGEIVTADSMQIYRRMDIGTAKPTVEEQQGIPHHLIDVAEPDEAFSVTRYGELADAVIADIAGRGKVPIIAGGTGFYIQALIDRWAFPPQPSDRALRDRLAAEAEAQGVAVLHARLREVDPLSAERLHPNDLKRIIRALEVYELTGRPLSSYQYRPEVGEEGPYRAEQYGLTLPREMLRDRLEQRVHAQLAAGLLEEVRRLYAAGYDPELPSMKGITYRQLLGYLRGDYDFQTAIELMVRDNRRYAKRQLTWFKADPRIRWIDIQAAGGPAGAAEIILTGWRAFIVRG